MLPVLLLVAAAAAASPPPAGAVAPGTPIVAIRVETGNVFDTGDPSSSSWPYRAANALHVVSREEFVRSLLLFRVGDPLDPAILAESERLLRATGFMNPVTITAHEVAGGAEVVVRTRDQWTLEVSLNLGILGDRRKWGLVLSEDNFLGWGKHVAVDYTDDSERTSYTLEYGDPVFLGTRWRLRAAARDASDGTASQFSLVYPFFALDTPRAGGVEWDQESLTEYLYAGGDQAVAGDASHRELRLWAGVRLPGGGIVTDRLQLGVFSERHTFGEWERLDGGAYAAPDDREMVGFEIGWHRELDNWRVVQGFRGWTTQEDVVIGPIIDIAVGFSLPALGGDRTRIPVRARGYRGWLVGPRYSWIEGEASGRLEGGEANNVVARMEAGVAHTGDTGWRCRIAADHGVRLDRDRQLTIGADFGLRGWDPDTFDGESRAVANLEWRRRLTGEVLNLAVIGFTAFVDVGRSWGGRVGPNTDGVRADAGIGLVAEITRAATIRVARFEVAVPDDGSGPVWLVTSGALF